MKYIIEEEDTYYLVDNVSAGVEKRIEITDQVTISELDKCAGIEDKLKDEWTYISCFNPYCDNIIRITKKQKRDLLLSFQKKYKKVVFVTCSDTCQKVVLDIFNDSNKT